MGCGSPLVSAVIPVFNGVTFLRDAIESVLAQTQRDVECIVVDDGSTDDSGRVAAEYCDRVRLETQRRAGVAAARNAGAALARGAIIAFLDADDTWLPSRIEVMVSELERREAEAVLCANFVRGESPPMGPLVRMRPDPITLESLLLWRGTVVSPSSNLLIRSETFEAIGGFNTSLSTAADFELLARLVQRGKLAYVDEPLVVYRWHDHNMTRDLRASEADLRRAYSLIISRGSVATSSRRTWGGLHRALAAANLRLGRRGAAVVHGVQWAARDPSEALGLVLRQRATKSAKRISGVFVARVALGLLRATARRAGVALLYHRVSQRSGDPTRELMPALAISTFERQLEYLTRHHRVVAPHEFLTAVLTRRRGARFPVCLTFDDDIPEHATFSAPALREAGIPAMFFLCGAFLDPPAGGFWWQRLQRAADLHGQVPGDLDLPRDVHAAAATIRDLDPPDVDAVTARLREYAGGDPAGELLSVDAASSLARRPMSIGFHTRRHRSLTNLDDKALEVALSEGRQALERIAGAPIATIAYPHGIADARIAAAARRAGFVQGFTSNRSAATPDSDPLLLGRVEAPPGSLGEFALVIVRTLLEGGRGH